MNLYAPVAQPVEHLTFNQGVRDSNSRRSTKKTTPLLRGCIFAPCEEFDLVSCHARKGFVTRRRPYRLAIQHMLSLLLCLRFFQLAFSVPNSRMPLGFPHPCGALSFCNKGLGLAHKAFVQSNAMLALNGSFQILR